MALANQTRRSASIPRRLIAERRLHLLPLYALLRTSDLAREGIENSGSYLFADHIYVGRASGRFLIGSMLDRIILSLPSASSFRNRFLHVKATLFRFLETTSGPRHVLSVPAGLPRDLVEVALQLTPSQRENVRFSILDLDPDVLRVAVDFVDQADLGGHVTTIEGDALDRDAFPAAVDFVTSTGLTEFLADDDVLRFYSNCREALEPGGILVTSSTIRHSLSAWLMEELAELRARYRDEKATGALLHAAGFRQVTLNRDDVGYQVLATAIR